MTLTNVSSALASEQLAEIERTLEVMLQERVPPASDDAIGRARHRAWTKSIKAALERIKEGSFGLCRWCGSPIPAQRLEVVPTAQGCISCSAAQRSAGL